MSWRPHGRANVDPYNLGGQAWSTCDRCGLIYNHKDLNWDRQWAGQQVINRRFLVCDICLDDLQEQLRTIVLPPDPVPIMNARPENYDIDETNFRVTMNGNLRVTMGGDFRITE